MKNFFSKKKNIVILSIILVILIVIAGVFSTIKYRQKKEAQNQKMNEIAVLKEKSKNIILEKETEENEQKYEEKYTEQYKKYEELSEEEKKQKEVIPKKYEVNYTVINNIIEEQKENTKTDIKEKETIKDDKTDIDYEFVVPKKYNLADKIKLNVEDQGGYGLCWDFAATKSLETNLQLTKKKQYDFSEMHVNYVTSDLLIGSREIDEGGNFSIYEDYLADSGAVLEKDVEYRDYEKNEYENFLNLKNEVTVTKTVNFPTIFKFNNYLNERLSEKDIGVVRNAVKNHIMNYGSVYAEVSMDDYNESTNTLYSNPNNFAFVDHAVSIVGWDDNYSKENFPEDNRPNNDGAYIALNSWGEEFGNNGYFYISYEDQNVESGLSGVVSTSMDDAYNINKIDNAVIKEIITSRLSNKLKEYKNEKYVTSLALSRITELDLSNKGIESLNGIDLFNELIILDLSNNNLKDKELKEIVKLNQLYGLNLSGNSELKDVGKLSDSTINYLNISKNEGIKGYEKLQNLMQLDISNCKLKNLENVAQLKKLEELNISQNDITDVSELKDLKELYSLIAQKCNLSDISSVVKLPQLSSLDLTDNQITNINKISQLNELYYLNLSQNNIKDFSPIGEINNNEEGILTLVLEGCNIKNIGLLNHLTNVSSLDLSNNDITDLSGFYNNSIYDLDLSGNKNLTNFQYLNNLKNLYFLYLQDCNIQDVSSIAKIQQLAMLDLSKNDINEIKPLNQLDELYGLSLAENNNLKGDLKINELQYLNIANIQNIDNKFTFNHCSEIEALNMSGCEDENLLSETLQNIENLNNIILENTNINEEILSNINNKGILLNGGIIKIKQKSEENDISIDNPKVSYEYQFDNDSPIRKAIMRSISSGEVEFIRCNLNKTLNKVEKTANDTNNVIIKIAYSGYYKDFLIEIEYAQKNEEQTYDESGENNSVVNNLESNNSNKIKNKSYTMVED